jgi:hypothetical protein
MSSLQNNLYALCQKHDPATVLDGLIGVLLEQKRLSQAESDKATIDTIISNLNEAREASEHLSEFN